MRASRIAALLFGSGFCALIYQTVWLRELRLIFGSSTAATAAVLAIFMGGLGIGGLVLGKRAERTANPLLFYGNLEIAIGLLAAASPVLLLLARMLYIAIGGTPVVGIFGGTLIRLLLAVLILGVATFLMGGTLPAAARAAEVASDSNRRNTALLYALNTLGAVAGVALSTFLLLEIMGNRQTLWFAALLNVLVGIIARVMSREADDTIAAPLETGELFEPLLSARHVLIAGAIVGFAFLLMELVWYRMLSPLLGGTTFTFGLILAVALFGIGAGGAAYAFLWSDRRASPISFAWTCSLEALCAAFSFALGDRIAVLALLLKPLGALGFQGHIYGWLLITMLVVFPASFIAGVQFPLLIALLGKGREQVARQVGLLYGWNTAGSILGSLAGGFGLIPLLSAPGVWRGVVILLAALGLLTLMISTRNQMSRLAAPAAVAILAVILVMMPGPSAAWRHSAIAIGGGRQLERTSNGIRAWIHNERRAVEWEADGRESSVALDTTNGYSFIVNGKSDGHSRMDAATQVMGGMVGAFIHPGPRRALVIGLGTGSTAGWLASVDSIERVDAIELEPAILHVARVCTPVNRNVMKNPKAAIFIGDAREVLLTTPNHYDIIFSEPSNPYRAGIASLYTSDFYQAAKKRLTSSGLFIQWVQTYDIDSRTVRRVYATLASVFPVVETWETQHGDLLLVGSTRPITYDADVLRARLTRQPFFDAAKNAWRTATLEGFLSHYVATNALTQAVAASELSINTDDRNLIEFGFARSVGRSGGFDVIQIHELAIARMQDTPDIRGFVDWKLVRRERIMRAAAEGRSVSYLHLTPEEESARLAVVEWAADELRSASLSWKRAAREPVGLIETSLAAELAADEGSPDAVKLIESLAAVQPVEAEAIRARLLWRTGRIDEARETLVGALRAYQRDPWPSPEVMKRAVRMGTELAREDRSRRSLVEFDQLYRSPFAVRLFEQLRKQELLNLASLQEGGEACGPKTLAALEGFEPSVPWTREFLTRRAACYAFRKSARAEKAEEDLERFLEHEPQTFGEALK